MLAVLFCLSATGQTSDEEYLYATFGYKEQLQKGLDDKDGYAWQPVSKYKFVNASGKLLWKKAIPSQFEFEGLYRDGEAKPCAVVAIYKEKQDMPKKDAVFICLPHPESGQDIKGKAKQYFEEQIAFGEELLIHYSHALTELAMVFSQRP